MSIKRAQWWLVVAILLMLVFTGLPYLFAAMNAGSGSVFGGFLLNPLDGNTYLAKMYEGWRGDWSFTLPYTAEQGKGAAINMLYLILGHLSKILGLSLLSAYHITRLLFSVVMLVALYRFIYSIFEEEKTGLIAFFLSAFGSGLGWMALVSGAFTSDFWVAETYPLLSAFTNPHFPLSLALLLILLTFKPDDGRAAGTKLQVKIGLFFVIVALFLAFVAPFGIVIALFILGGLVAWEMVPDMRHIHRSPVFQRAVWIFFGGVPVLAYEYLAIARDPLLSVWNAQNTTPSPQWWDFIISLSPAILLAAVGIFFLIKNKVLHTRLLIVWAITGFILIYFPWNLQRRFMMGFYIPLCALAVYGLGVLARSRKVFNTLTIVLLILALPTNLVILLAARQGVIHRDPKLFLSSSEVEAFHWLEANTAGNAVILASPDSGLYIPAYTGRRVIYGHPFETVGAVMEKGRVMAFFKDPSSIASAALLGSVDYLFWGPRESSLGTLNSMDRIITAYQNPGVTIFQIVP